jgi:phosphatidate cytidylyltransferase
LFTVVFFHTKTDSRNIAAHGFLTIFVTLFMTSIAKLNMDVGALGVLWIFIIAWMTDTGAYFSGVLLGKHKLVPHISPKKTVEGAIGGIICAVVAGVVYSLILKNSVRLTLLYAAMCLVGSAIAQIGDFAASCIKRDCNVKDYGFILPGHGGFMDRFDSVVFAAPFVCLAVTYLAGIR